MVAGQNNARVCGIFITHWSLRTVSPADNTVRCLNAEPTSAEVGSVLRQRRVLTRNWDAGQVWLRHKIWQAITSVSVSVGMAAWCAPQPVVVH